MKESSSNVIVRSWRASSVMFGAMGTIDSTYSVAGGGSGGVLPSARGSRAAKAPGWLGYTRHKNELDGSSALRSSVGHPPPPPPPPSSPGPRPSPQFLQHSSIKWTVSERPQVPSPLS